jgi:hypothetical protein
MAIRHHDASDSSETNLSYLLTRVSVYLIPHYTHLSYVLDVLIVVQV